MMNPQRRLFLESNQIQAIKIKNLNSKLEIMISIGNERINEIGKTKLIPILYFLA